MFKFYATTIGLVATVSVVVAGPCDIYASADTPCVAAHSTTRALYSAYTGELYQVLRNSDSTTKIIYPLEAGGVADSAAQDTFCEDTTCIITIIYDQSGKGNHLTEAPPGGATSGPQTDGYDNWASAIGAPVTLNGQKAYGVFISPGTGYRIDDTSGVATGNEPEGIYAVLDGTHYNGACCFDYGNAEKSNDDTGDGHMEAIYFGDCDDWGTGAGSGPWIMADMENGLFSGESAGNNAADLSISDRFITAVVKGEADYWEIRGGNAVSGSLSTFYSGVRPSGYTTMDKEGSILLGIGGDNSDGSQGTFYEGALTSGYPSDATDALVQANIVAAKYAITSLVSGQTLTVGDTVSFRATTDCCTAYYIAHTGTAVNLQVVTSSSSTALKEEASWTVVTGLGNSGCFSFESVDTPGSYIRHDDFVLLVNADDGTALFAGDSTFCPQSGLNGEYSSIRSWSYPTRYFRHYDYIGYIASQGGPETFDTTTTYTNDTTFQIETGFAS